MVQLPTLVCGGREAVVMAPNPTCDSAVSPCLHGCLSFLHRHFPPPSPPSHPLDPSLCSQQQPSPWDCSMIPKFQLQATAPSRRLASLSRLCMAVAKNCLILMPSRQPQISCFALSLIRFSSQTSASMWGLDPCFSSPTG